MTRKMREFGLTTAEDPMKTAEDALYARIDEPIYCSPAHAAKSAKDWIDSSNVSSPTRHEDRPPYQALRSYSMDYISLYDLPKWKDKEQEDGQVQANPAYGTIHRSRTVYTPRDIHTTSPSQ